MKRLLAFFLDAIFPARCLNCGIKTENKDKSELICEKCFAEVEINNGFSCPKCGKRIFDYKKSCHPEEKFVLAAASSYKNHVVRELIHALKYRFLKPATEPLALILELYLEKIAAGSSFNIKEFVIIPIPIHPKKERERGFNQTFLIIKQLKNATNPLQIETDVLFKIKNVGAQMALADYEKRAANVKNCFGVSNKEKIIGKNILLFDDVCTSGATMKEAVRVLKENGAKKIIGLVIAKA